MKPQLVLMAYHNFPLVVTIQQPSASSLRRFRHLFRDRSDLFRSQGSARVARSMRMYESVIVNDVLVIKSISLHNLYNLLRTTILIQSKWLKDQFYIFNIFLDY